MPTSHDDHTSNPRILDKALAMLAEFAPDRGVLIDVPCGTGHLTQKATAEGWTVVPCDLEPDAWLGPDDVDVRQLDLDQPFALDDDCADAIACCEGIEHVENPWHVLREFRRILKPGGSIVITLPNTIDLRQRFRMVRRGFWGHYIPSVPYHINHMGPFVLTHGLIREGFRIRSIGSPAKYGGLLYRLLVPMLGYGKKCGLPADVRAMLSTQDVLRGRTAVIVATLES